MLIAHLRAKLRQLVRQDALTLPEKESLKTVKAKLESGLEAHYKALEVLAPNLPVTLLTPIAAHKDPIRIASHFSISDRDSYGLQKLAELELEFRVAHGHEWIEKVKSLLGVRSFTTRHAKQTHGQTKNTRAQAAVRRAERKVVQAAAVYTKNFERLQALTPPPAKLAGLQELLPTELKLLGTWLEEELYKRGDTALPWFWKLRPLQSSDGTARSDPVEIQVEQWNEEGV